MAAARGGASANKTVGCCMGPRLGQVMDGKRKCVGWRCGSEGGSVGLSRSGKEAIGGCVGPEMMPIVDLKYNVNTYTKQRMIRVK